MIRCKSCLMPDTRPDTEFVDGECSACIEHRARRHINWGERREALVALLADHDKRCMVASSGGKDSHFIVHTLLELGADVTTVTATTCHETALGRRNLNNLARYAPRIEATPNAKHRAELNVSAMELVGDPSWPEHVAVHVVPRNIAAQFDHTLVFYGENPLDTYGGPIDRQRESEMTAAWAQEFGGFLGLRPADMEHHLGLADGALDYYKPYPDQGLADTECYFLGSFVPWDSLNNAKVARGMGMRGYHGDSSELYWECENLDNAQTGLHDLFMFRKYGYSRIDAQISCEIRHGHITREAGILALEHFQVSGAFAWYLGVTQAQIADGMGTTTRHVINCLREHTNTGLMKIAPDGTARLLDWGFD